jgi:DNA-binding transcriptional LysR family regulator
MLDARQLRHFVTVTETLHFGRAAAKLGMTQPPLSQSILALERSLGMKLFERTKRSVALTEAGKQWLPEVLAALFKFDQLSDKAIQLRDGVSGNLEISFISTADYSILPDLVRRYGGHYPDVRISLTEATSDIQIAEITEGKGDLGIIIPPSGGLPEALGYRQMLTEPLIAAVPETWITSGRLALTSTCIPAALLADAPMIGFPARIAPAFYDLVSGFYAEHGKPQRVAQEAIQMQTIISLVSAGIGVSLVPASLRNLARTGVRYLDLLEPAPQLETGLIWRCANGKPTLKKFLETASPKP